MSEVKTWSETPSSNQETSPDGWPEGQTRSSVNNSARENMAQLRTVYEDPQWVDLLAGDGSFTVAKSADDQVTINSDESVNAEFKFPLGCRVRVGNGSTWRYGFVTSAVFITPDTIVTMDLDQATVVQADADRMETHVTKGTIQRTAFSPLGLTTGENPPEVPTVDDLGDAAFEDQGEGNGLDADTVDGLHALDIIDQGDVRSESLLVNSDFGVWGRGTSIDATTWFLNDNGVYVSDQWVLLMGDETVKPATTLGVVDCARDDGIFPHGVASSSCRLTANGFLSVGPSEKVGLFQPIEARDCRFLKNGTVSLSAWFRINAGAAIGRVQIAVIEWTGAADTLSSVDCVQDWGAIEEVDPTLIASYAYAGSTVSAGGLVPTDSWQELKLEDIPISINMENLCVLLWIDDIAWSGAAADKLYVSGVNLVQGDRARSYQGIDRAKSRSRCQRYFTKTFSEDVTPSQGLTSTDCVGARTNASVDDGYTIIYDLPESMFEVPAVTTFNPQSVNANFRAYGSGAGDVSVPTPNIGTSRIRWDDANAGSGVYFNHLILTHATAEAVL